MLRIFLLFLLFFSAIFAQTSPDARLKKVEDYFNGLTSLQASFIQVNNSRSLLRGTVAIQKPGKMRADYGDDSPLLMIADGAWVVNYDKELKQASHVPLSSHPVELMLRSSLSFSEGFDVKNIESNQGLLKVTVTKKDAMEAGTVTFIFIENPIELREWVAVDGQGNVTRVSLSNIQKNIPLSSSLFIAPKE